MGEEAYSEFELDDWRGGSRTLIVRGGYGRREVWLGICDGREHQPGDLIPVDLQQLRRVLEEMR